MYVDFFVGGDDDEDDRHFFIQIATKSTSNSGPIRANVGASAPVRNEQINRILLENS